MIKILSISGSLRQASQNAAVLHATARLAPGDCSIAPYTGLGGLPLFNPDLEETEIPSVTDFRNRIRAADGILIASPEYAHGITGVLKNALDWVVGSGEFEGKPVGLLNASMRATHAHASLEEVLSVMGARIIQKASLTLPLTSNRIDESGILSDRETSGILSCAIAALCEAVRDLRQADPDSWSQP
ncbi:MAG: NADPH-dependent FMN reductase [Leptospirales bacterium]